MINPIAVIALAAAIGCSCGWYVQGIRYQGKIYQIERDKALVDMYAMSLWNIAGEQYENSRVELELKTHTVTKQIIKYVDRPVYKNICIDQDGLDAINSLIQP